MDHYPKSQHELDRDGRDRDEVWSRYSKPREEILYRNPWTFEPQTICPSPILIDIFMGGLNLPFAHGQASLDVFKDDHLLEIMQLMPEAVHCKRGELRCRQWMAPLAVAAWNPSVNVKWIEALVRYGANPKQTVCVVSQETDLYKDLISCADGDETKIARAELVKQTLAALTG